MFVLTDYCDEAGSLETRQLRTGAGARPPAAIEHRAGADQIVFELSGHLLAVNLALRLRRWVGRKSVVRCADPANAARVPWTAEAAIAYVDHHVTVWNSHDLDEIVALYGRDVELVSPLAEEVVGSPVVRGRDGLRDYFGAALKADPQLRFEVLDVLRGEDSITFYMRSIGGRKVAEVLFIDADGLIGKVYAHYSCR